MEPERSWSLDAQVAETRADLRSLRSEVSELRQDFRRLDDRFFQLLLLQVGTLIAALASVVTAIVTAFAVY